MAALLLLLPAALAAGPGKGRQRLQPLAAEDKAAYTILANENADAAAMLKQAEKANAAWRNRAAKILQRGHDVLVLISEVWGGFSPEAMRFLGELAQARNDGIDIERASTTWSTSSFTSYHGQLLSLAVQWGVAIEIERAIKKSARFC